MQPMAIESQSDSTVLLTVDDYDDAVAAIDKLARAGFPIEQASIVGHGVEVVEQVTGRSGPGRVAASGAFNGALIGLFFGLLFDWWGALTPAVGWGWLALAGLAYGALLGAAIAMLFEFFAPRDRDFASTRSLVADRYDVVLRGGEPAAARRILGAPAEG